MFIPKIYRKKEEVYIKEKEIGIMRGNQRIIIKLTRESENTFRKLPMKCNQQPLLFVSLTFDQWRKRN